MLQKTAMAAGSLKILPAYWTQRRSWNDMFNKSTMPTVEQVYNWLTSRENGVTKFYNIGTLTALLICGDIIEAGIMPMPSSYEMAQLICKVGKGAQDGMQLLGLVRTGADRNDFINAFVSLDAYIEGMLGEEEKRAMGYNVVMLEHALCKMKRLTTHGVPLEDIRTEI